MTSACHHTSEEITHNDTSHAMMQCASTIMWVLMNRTCIQKLLALITLIQMTLVNCTVYLLSEFPFSSAL
jgi:hypothetical protein